MGRESILDDILNKEKDSISIEEEALILKPLIDEINLITDDGIRSFVRSILIRATSFWTIPSSFSGKYHPSDEHNQGGNMLHTKRVVRASKVIGDSYSLSSEERDLVYAACLLHDITKGITSKDDEKSFDSLMSRIAAAFKAESTKSHAKLSTPNTKCAADVLKAHMDHKHV
jgi:hypothetical protein